MDRDVQFSPTSRVFLPAIGCGPQGFSSDLQAGAVDDQLDRFSMSSRFRGDVERRRSPRQGAVIRNGQVIETRHAEQ